MRPERASELGLPLGAGRGTSIVFTVDCAGSGTCAAGGTYTGKHKNSIPMVATQASGRWARAVRIGLPADAAASPFAAVTSMDCTAVGSCLAVGFYYLSSGTGQTASFAATEVRGRWTRAHLLAAPAGGGSPSVFGVSCYAAGSCTAVGGYAGSAPLDSPFAISEAHGRWGAARPLLLPPDGETGTMFAVSCPGPGSCEAVGSYIGGTDNNQAIAVTESDGSWRRGLRIKLPPNATPGNFLASVSCPTARSCTAVGNYTTIRGTRPIAAAFSGGTWGPARAIDLVPGNADRHHDSWLTAVSCLRSGSCLALGHYFDKARRVRVMIMTKSAGRWRDAREVDPPPNGKADSSPDLFGSFFGDGGAGCASAGYCAIGTFYQDKAGIYDAMTATTTPASPTSEGP